MAVLGAAAALGSWLALTHQGQAAGTLWLGVIAALIGPAVTLWLWHRIAHRLGGGRLR